MAAGRSSAGFEMAVEMGDGAEPDLARDARVDLGDAALAEMRDGAELALRPRRWPRR